LAVVCSDTDTGFVKPSTLKWLGEVRILVYLVCYLPHQVDRIWSGAVEIASAPFTPAFYIGIYAAITFLGQFIAIYSFINTLLICINLGLILEALKWFTLCKQYLCRRGKLW
jgi:hypothetical protein